MNLKTLGTIMSVVGGLVMMAAEAIRSAESRKLTEEIVREEVNKKFDEMSTTPEEES